ncbi:MAG TPA: hypothetical protein VK724_18420 [Bryobacteraceae bacterium]|nr:hypothetical protein [Bryobacteraceae bacterium]
MRYCLFVLLVAAASLAAQQSNVTSTTSVDINGNQVADGPRISQTRSATGSVTTETRQSINGGSVPVERVEEHVLRDDASGRVVERLIRRYDPQGNPMPSVKETIEEQKNPDGSSTTQSTTSRGDINGNMQVIERTITDSRPNGSGESSQTIVQRPTANGLETVEKREEVVVKQGKDYQSEATTYRNDGNGGFYAAVKQTTEHKEQNGQSSDSSAEYESTVNGQIQLHSQTVTETVTRPDGSKDAVVNIYGRNVPGTVSDSGLKLQEQQVIETTPGPNHTVVQTLSVRRPTVSDPQSLGPARQLSETVCQGDCKPAKTGP